MEFKIVLFNHKGGVSKTTTAYNLGWMLAKLGKKVLLVDADPQCNLTSLLLNETFDDYYTNAETKYHNIKDGVKVAFEGKPRPIEAVDCYSPAENENLFLLAGHANLSEYDASLSLAQTTNNSILALMNLPGAFNELINKTSIKYNIDFVLIDLNPGLSAINQNLFSLSDGFIVPTNPDPFSIMAIESLAKILPKWVDWTERMRTIYMEAAYPLSESKPKFIGGIIQKFNIRKGKASKSAGISIEGVKKSITETLLPAMKASNMLFDEEIYTEINIFPQYCIAEIPDFQGLIHKAYAVGKPVFDLTEEDIRDSFNDNQNLTVGKVFDTYIEMRDNYKKQFTTLAQQLITLKDKVYANRTQSISI